MFRRRKTACAPRRSGGGGLASPVPAFVALLRGVNVGKGKRVPMGELRACSARWATRACRPCSTAATPSSVPRAARPQSIRSTLLPRSALNSRLTCRSSSSRQANWQPSSRRIRSSRGRMSIRACSWRSFRTAKRWRVLPPSSRSWCLPSALPWEACRVPAVRRWHPAKQGRCSSPRQGGQVGHHRKWATVLKLHALAN